MDAAHALTFTLPHTSAKRQKSHKGGPRESADAARASGLWLNPLFYFPCGSSCHASSRGCGSDGRESGTVRERMETTVETPPMWMPSVGEGEGVVRVFKSLFASVLDVGRARCSKRVL